MRFNIIVSLLFAPAALCVNLPLNALQSRKDGCEAYGDYPEYTGPCEDTSEIHRRGVKYMTTK